MSNILKMMSGAGLRAPVAESVDLDGTNDYFSRASDLTGNADGKTFTTSFWFEPNAAAAYTIYDSGGAFVISTDASNQITVIGKNAAGTTILSLTITAPTYAIRTENNCIISLDLANSANRSASINDVAASVTWTTYTNDSINFTNTTHTIGALVGGTAKAFSRLSRFFLDYTYRDLSIEANRRLFITADRKPAAGQAALNPILYLPMTDPTTAHINSGTGGNFTLNGTIARSGRGPNQFNAPYIALDGSSQYLINSTIPSQIDSKTAILHFVINETTWVSGRTFFSLKNNTAGSFAFRMLNDGVGGLSFTASDTSGNAAVAASLLSTFVVGRNYVMTITFDTSSTSNRFWFVNGIDVTSSVTWTTYVNTNIDYSSASNLTSAVGANTAGGSFVACKVSTVFFHTQYIDLSVAANLAKFVTGTGIDAKPVDLGANGELPFGTAPLIYLPMYANNAGKNYGTGGDFTVNSGPYPGVRGPNEFFGNLATFNGTTSAISKTSQLTGAADGKVFLLSFHVYKNASALYTICDTTGAAFRVTIDASNQLVILAENAGGTGILSATVTTTVANTTNTHVLVSIDLANTSNRAVYLNNVAASVTWTTYTNDSIDFTVADFYIGTETGGSNDLAGKLAEFFFTTPAAYFDITQEANRLLFRDAFGNPVDLGANGSTPLGTSPLVYLRFDSAAFGANSGTGGAFTPANITDGGQL